MASKRYWHTYNQVIEEKAEESVVAGYILENGAIARQVNQNGESMLCNFLHNRSATCHLRGARKSHWNVSNQKLEMLHREQLLSLEDGRLLD
jgi:hypothetical protein